MPSTKTCPARPSFRAADLFDRLDAAMHLWPRRQLEPPQLLEKTFEGLHEVWAAVRFTLGDDLEAPPARPASSSKRRPAADDRLRTKTARAKKAPDDERRERYIVKRYAVHVRKAKTARAAREAVAAEIRKGMYLLGYDPDDWTWDPPYQTYSEKSVARVLKKYAAR
jgi:hypothetical protein